VEETGDHLGRKGAKLGGGVGLVVGLFSPPLLAATLVGAAAGGVVAKFAQHKVTSGIGEKLGDALPPGSAGILAIYDRARTDLVHSTLVSAVRTSSAEIDGGGAKDLKAALAEAQAGMGGG
jgi:arylsulfatase